MKKHIKRFLSTTLALTLTALLGMSAVGCSNEQTVATDGSTSMEKVIGALGEAFKEENSSIKFTYNPTGSSAGITAVSEGSCDIGLSSRALKDEEKAAGLTETVIALDGIALIVNTENPVNSLDTQTVADIFTGKITNWKDVGGNDSEIVVIGRESSSGTRDGFESITGTSGKCVYRNELTSTGDVITTVSQNPAAIGYASIASIKDTVKAISYDGVAATEENVKNGTYTLKRPFVFVTKKDTALSEAAQKFYDFCLSAKGSELIASAGVIPVN